MLDVFLIPLFVLGFALVYGFVWALRWLWKDHEMKDWG